MKKQSRTLFLCLFLSLCSVFVAFSNATGAGYESLKGMKSVKAVFDVRIADPQSAALHLDLIHQTFKDKNLALKGTKPTFAVIFMGPAVKLLSKNTTGVTPGDQKALDAIAGTIGQMSKEGISLEVCIFAVKVFGVDPASLLPEIKQVANGWISLIGYEAHGYSLVPAY